MSGTGDNIPVMFSKSNADRNKKDDVGNPWWMHMTRQQIRFSLIFFSCMIQATVLFFFGSAKEQFPVMIGLALVACLLIAILSATVFVGIVIRKHRRRSVATVAHPNNSKAQPI